MLSFLYVCMGFIVVKFAHIKFPIATILKHTVQLHWVHSRCCVIISSTWFQNCFYHHKVNPEPIHSHPGSRPSTLCVYDVLYKCNHTACGLW